MAKFDPSGREKSLVFEVLPATKEAVISHIRLKTGLPEAYARSLIWNMKRVGQVYTFDGQIRKV